MCYVNRVLAEAALELVMLALFADDLEDDALEAGRLPAAGRDHGI